MKIYKDGIGWEGLEQVASADRGRLKKYSLENQLSLFSGGNEF